jgi:hypothetical protein
MQWSILHLLWPVFCDSRFSKFFSALLEGTRVHETGETLHWSFEAPASKEHFSDVSLPDPLGDERRAASFHALDFDYDGQQVYVFFCLWQDRLKSGSNSECGIIGTTASRPG